MPIRAADTPALARPASLKDAAYRQIKALLLAGRLAADRLYSAPYFAEMLGVSRTPVREALLQLAGEGLLVCHDVRGFQLRRFTAKEIGDVSETRALIETHVLGRVAPELTADDLRRMDQALKAMSACARKGDAPGFLEADKEFHLVPFERCGNQHLLAVLEDIRNHISLFSLQALAHPGRFDEVLREHAAILKALKHKDRKQAVQALAHHLATTEGYWLKR